MSDESTADNAIFGFGMTFFACGILLLKSSAGSADVAQNPHISTASQPRGLVVDCLLLRFLSDNMKG